MASAVVCWASILILAMAISASISSASSHPLTEAEKATDHAITKEKRNLLPEKVTSLASTEVEGKNTGSYWGKAKKLDDDDDDSDHDRDSDHDHDSDSDHDHDSDSDHDHDHDSDSDHDRDHDSDSDRDHDSDSDHDRDHDSDNDSDDDDESGRKKKHSAQGRKGAPGSKRDERLAKVGKKV